MIDLRTLCHQRVSGDSDITDIVGDRVFQRSAFDRLGGVPEVKPFIVHTMGNDRTAGPSAVRGRANVVHFWVHDDPGDYGDIDLVLDRIKVVMESTPASGDFLEATWIERSQDLEDPEMHTICRFSRVQLMTVNREEIPWS